MREGRVPHEALCRVVLIVVPELSEYKEAGCSGYRVFARRCMLVIGFMSPGKYSL